MVDGKRKMSCPIQLLYLRIRYPGGILREVFKINFKYVRESAGMQRTYGIQKKWAV